VWQCGSVAVWQWIKLCVLGELRQVAVAVWHSRIYIISGSMAVAVWQTTINSQTATAKQPQPNSHSHSHSHSQTATATHRSASGSGSVSGSVKSPKESGSVTVNVGAIVFKTIQNHWVLTHHFFLTHTICFFDTHNLFF
jgi:hypothetical protein